MTIWQERGRSENLENYYYYHYDMRGSVSNILATNKASGAITLAQGYDYDSFGNADPTKPESGFKNDVQFTGGIKDKATGLIYLNARHYNPATGRFMQKDTYRGQRGDPGSHNLYGYCTNNPVNMIDPSGHIYIPGIDGVTNPANKKPTNTHGYMPSSKLKPTKGTAQKVITYTIYTEFKLHRELNCTWWVDVKYTAKQENGKRYFTSFELVSDSYMTGIRLCDWEETSKNSDYKYGKTKVKITAIGKVCAFYKGCFISARVKAWNYIEPLKF